LDTDDFWKGSRASTKLPLGDPYERGAVFCLRAAQGNGRVCLCAGGERLGDKFSGPEVFQKDSPGKDFYLVRDQSRFGITGDQNAAANLVFLPESDQSFQMMRLSEGCPFDLDRDFVVSENKTDHGCFAQKIKVRHRGPQKKQNYAFGKIDVLIMHDK
jgi:hypothetical protein